MTKKPESKTVVLRKVIDEKEASAIIDDKKTASFKSLMKKPKKEDVHVDSIKLFYECLLMVSGKYVADYYRKVVHTVSVDSNVQEIAFGGGTFSIRSKSKFKKAFVGNIGKNKIDLPLEEHVFIEEEGELVFDHNGTVIKFPFKINSKTIENYPDQILAEHSTNVKNTQITQDSAINSLKKVLKKSLDPDIRKLNDEFNLDKITKVYIPIYEARLTGPKNKVGLLRLDAARKKFL